MVTARPRGGLEGWVHVFGKRVAEEHLLGEPENEQHQPAGDALLGIGASVGALVELMHDLAPAHERAGENLREESDVEPIADEVVTRRPPSPQIRQVHHMMEREERDAERQGDVE